MSNETKTPQAGEYWFPARGKPFLCIAANDRGDTVWKDWVDTYYLYSDDCIWKHWRYEPRCDSFDWVEPPAEVWTKCVVNPDESCRWYIKRISANSSQHISSTRIEPNEAWGATKNELVESGSWIEVTEAEALARVKTANPLPALIPGIATDRMVDLFLSWRLPSDFQPDGGISFTSRPIHESWPTGTNLFTATQARGMIEHLLSVPEEKSRVKPAEPVNPAMKALHELAITAGIDPLGLNPADIAEKLIAKQQVTGCSGESPDSVPENRPAREVIREIVRLIADSSMTDEESADMAFQIGKQWLDDNPEDPAPFAKPFTDPRSGMGIQKDHVSWRPNGQRHEVATEVTYHAETPAESPDDWVTQDRVPARPGIDERRYHYSSGDISAWADSACMDWNRPVMNRAPIKHSGGWVELRCRRRDLPAQPAPIDHERWFMWSDDRYPIAFVKRAGGKVFNLNVDGMFKTSDDWGASYEEKLINGEMIEVTEESAKAYLKRPRRKIIDPPAPQPKRIPVRLWCLKNNVQNVGSGVIACVENPDSGCDMWQKVKFDGSGFYVEGGE